LFQVTCFTLFARPGTDQHLRRAADAKIVVPVPKALTITDTPGTSTVVAAAWLSQS